MKGWNLVSQGKQQTGPCSLRTAKYIKPRRYCCRYLFTVRTICLPFPGLKLLVAEGSGSSRERLLALCSCACFWVTGKTFHFHLLNTESHFHSRRKTLYFLRSLATSTNLQLLQVHSKYQTKFQYETLSLKKTKKLLSHHHLSTSFLLPLLLWSLFLTPIKIY